MNVDDISCSMCQKSFKTSYSLKRHCMNVHQVPTTVPRPVCQQSKNYYCRATAAELGDQHIASSVEYLPEQQPTVKDPASYMYGDLSLSHFVAVSAAVKQLLEQQKHFSIPALCQFVEEKFTNIPIDVIPYVVHAACEGAKHASQCHQIYLSYSRSELTEHKRTAANALISLTTWNIGPRPGADLVRPDETTARQQDLVYNPTPKQVLEERRHTRIDSSPDVSDNEDIPIRNTTAATTLTNSEDKSALDTQSTITGPQVVIRAQEKSVADSALATKRIEQSVVPREDDEGENSDVDEMSLYHRIAEQRGWKNERVLTETLGVTMQDGNQEPMGLTMKSNNGSNQADLILFDEDILSTAMSYEGLDSLITVDNDVYEKLLQECSNVPEVDRQQIIQNQELDLHPNSNKQSDLQIIPRPQSMPVWEGINDKNQSKDTTTDVAHCSREENMKNQTQDSVDKVSAVEKRNESVKRLDDAVAKTHELNEEDASKVDKHPKNKVKDKSQSSRTAVAKPKKVERNCNATDVPEESCKENKDNGAEKSHGTKKTENSILKDTENPVKACDTTQDKKKKEDTSQKSQDERKVSKERIDSTKTKGSSVSLHQENKDEDRGRETKRKYESVKGEERRKDKRSTTSPDKDEEFRRQCSANRPTSEASSTLSMRGYRIPKLQSSWNKPTMSQSWRRPTTSSATRYSTQPSNYRRGWQPPMVHRYSKDCREQRHKSPDREFRSQSGRPSSCQSNVKDKSSSNSRSHSQHAEKSPEGNQSSRHREEDKDAESTPQFTRQEVQRLIQLLKDQQT
jgi:hypothetical protein